MIQYSLKLTHVENSPELVSRLEDKFSQVTKFIHSDLNNAFAEIELEKTTEHHKQGDIFRAEINLKVGDGNFFRADATTSSLFSAIDDVKSKISKEVRRHYKKENDILRRSGRAMKKVLKGFRK